MFDQQEIIGASTDYYPEILRFLTAQQESMRKAFEHANILVEKSNSRLIDLEHRLNDLNQRRARYYNRRYTPPKVLYLNRKGLLNPKVNGQLGQYDISEHCQYVSASHISMLNLVVLFDDYNQNPDINLFMQARLLRHEMAHAGSINRIRATASVKRGTRIDSYRSGAALEQKKRGELVNEGHNSTEDLIMTHRIDLFEQWPVNRHLSRNESLATLFPTGYGLYCDLQDLLVNNGIIKQYDTLLSYRRNGTGVYHGSASSNEYRNVMMELYRNDPNLFPLAEDMIYGDKWLPFAKRVDDLYGKGFFGRIMRVRSEEEAIVILREIT